MERQRGAKLVQQKRGHHFDREGKIKPQPGLPRSLLSRIAGLADSSGRSGCTLCANLATIPFPLSWGKEEGAQA
jgi:hypothetical protein